MRIFLKNIYFIILFILACLITTNSFSKEININEKENINFFNRLSEGQQLLLRPKVNRILYDDNIYALKQNEQLYYALTDIIDILDLAINFDEQQKTGSGWFLREDWGIVFDLNKKTINSRDRSFKIEDQNIIEQNGILYIAQSDIEKWFDFKLDVDIPQQFVEIASLHPLPAVLKQNRAQKSIRRNTSNRDTKFPRKEIEEKWLDINTLDVRLGTRFERIERANTGRVNSNRNTAIFAAQGDALKHNAYLLSNYNNADGLSSVTARLSKRDEDATLLGPLKARSYIIGDTNLTRIPLTGNINQELGLRVTNSPLNNNQFQTTNINGDAIPGWDVELYRNNILISTQTVPQSGQYDFLNVALFSGDNEFEIFFYGPQGEVRFKNINLPVTSELLKAQNNIYDFSASFSETQTFESNQSTDEDEGEFHLAARFNKKIGDFLAYVGFRKRQVDEVDKEILAAGFTGIYKDALLDANFGADLDGQSAAQLTARKNINGWNIITRGALRSDNFSPNGEIFPTTIDLGISTQKSFRPTPATRFNISTNNSYIKNSNNQSQILSELGTSYQISGINFSNTINYEVFEGSDNEKQKDLDNNFSMRMNAGKFFLRGNADYNILPDAEINNYGAQIGYRPHNKFSSDLNIQRRPVQDITEARLNFNYTHDYFRASPFLEYDSNNDLYAGLNINFSAAKIPNNDFITVTNKPFTGRGLISSFVYHDKNGNMLFDGDDEVLPDVIVESMNIRRRAITNDAGYSLINDLPSNRATDIQIDKSTLPDSFMIAANKGESVFPDGGDVIALEFPIHLSGEIDGTVSLVTDETGEEISAVKRAKIDLHPLDHTGNAPIKTQAAHDGFFVVSQIPPGRYLMAISNETAQKNNAAAPMPKIIEIGYDGDVLYGKDIQLDANKPHIPVNVSYLEKRTENIVTSPKEIYAVNIKPQGRSKLSALLSDYAKKKANKSVYDGLTRTRLTDQNETYTLPSNDMQSAYTTCQKLAEQAIPCALEVVVAKSSIK